MKHQEIRLPEDKIYGLSSSPNKFLCEECVMGKLQKAPFIYSESCASNLLEHSDVCDKTEYSFGGNLFFITDDKS